VTRQHSSVRYCAPSSVFYRLQTPPVIYKISKIHTTTSLSRKALKKRPWRTPCATRRRSIGLGGIRQGPRRAHVALLLAETFIRKLKHCNRRCFKDFNSIQMDLVRNLPFGNSQGRIELGSARVTAFQARERVVLRICYCVVARVTALRLRLSFIDSTELSATIAPPKVCCALPDRHTMTHPSCSTCCAATPTCAAPPH